MDTFESGTLPQEQSEMVLAQCWECGETKLCHDRLQLSVVRNRTGCIYSKSDHREKRALPLAPVTQTGASWRELEMKPCISIRYQLIDDCHQEVVDNQSATVNHLVRFEPLAGKLAIG